MTSTKTTTITVRLPNAVATRLNTLAAKKKITRNDYLRIALQRYAGFTGEGKVRSHHKKS